MNRKNNEGSSLIEILIAIVLLAVIVIPACSSLVLSHRINAKTEEMLQAQLAVSSAVETLMAEGIPSNYTEHTHEGDYGYDFVEITENGEKVKKPVDLFPNVKIVVMSDGDSIPYYNVTVSSNVDPSDAEAEPDVVVTTTIRTVEAVPVETTQDPVQEGGSQ